jgi:hypothetical protein
LFSVLSKMQVKADKHNIKRRGNNQTSKYNLNAPTRATKLT